VNMNLVFLPFVLAFLRFAVPSKADSYSFCSNENKIIFLEIANTKLANNLAGCYKATPYT